MDASFILGHSGAIYTVALFAAMAVVAYWEGARPRRPDTHPIGRRWAGNFGIALINAICVRVAIPITSVGVAMWANAQGFGLMALVDLPLWLAIGLGFLFVDFGRYLHHYIQHQWPLLWRLHHVHHADQDYDFTIGVRFHPLEGLFTTAFMLVVIAAVGPPPLAVVFAEVAIAISGLVVHANGRTPRWVERYVRLIFVTPDMHRVHHSVVRREHDSNYSAVLSLWDRLLGTYVAAPAAGHEGMTIGLAGHRGPECLGLGWMLSAPFRSGRSGSPPSIPARETRSQ